MTYEILTLQQGTELWHAHRNGCYNGSDLSAAMGTSSYKSRTDLVRQLATGEQQEVDAATQRRFDDGHRFEALARPLAEEIIGADLYPITVSMRVDGLSRPLSSSLDGATDADVPINFEHKRMNARLAEFLAREEIPEEYWPQMEQGMLINGAERTLFMASLWNENNELVEEMHCWYESRPELRAKIVPTWKQIEADVAAYVPQEVIPAAVAAPQQALPAVFANVTGSIEVRDNLNVFGDALRAYIGRLNMKPETDQDFANLDASAKLLRETQERIKAAKDSALGQITSIDTMKRIADELEELARTTAISIEKLVTAEKQNRKNAILIKAKDDLRAHIESLNSTIGKPYMPDIAWADFVGKAKGLKTIASLQNAMDTELARAKIESNSVAINIQNNMATLLLMAADFKFLFPDTETLVLKDNDDLKAVITARIAEHKAAEEKRLEAERERIRKEEEARAAAKVKEGQEEVERKRREAHEMAMQEIQGIAQQVIIAQQGRLGVRVGGTIECIRETLAETEAWVIDERFGALIGSAQDAKDKAVADIRALLSEAEDAEKMKAAQGQQQQFGINSTIDAPAVAEAKNDSARQLMESAATAPTLAQVLHAAAPAEIANALAPVDNGKRLKLGDINARLYPLSVTAEVLKHIGFEPEIDRNAKLYREQDFQSICYALVQHITKAANGEVRKAA